MNEFRQNVTRDFPPTTSRGYKPGVGVAIYQDAAPVTDRLDRYYQLVEALERRGILKCALFRSSSPARPLAAPVGSSARSLDLAYGFVGNLLRIQGLRQHRERLYDRFVSARWRTIKPDVVVCNYKAPSTRGVLNDWNARLVFLDKSSLRLRKWSESGDPAQDARAWRAGELTVNSPDRFRLACDHVITMEAQDLPWYRAFGVHATFLPNGIDVSWWKDQASKYAENTRGSLEQPSNSRAMRWLGIGTAPDRKNLMLLLSAWERSRCPGQLSVVGVPDTREWRDKLNPVVARLGDTLKVHYGKQAMSPHYACSDVLVLPTRAEGAPRVVLEAACFGVPALTTLPGRGGFVEEGRTGWLLDPITVEGLAERIVALAQVPDAVRQVGAKAALAVGDFDVGHYGERIADVVDGVVSAEEARNSTVS